MPEWKDQFLNKLDQVQTQWSKRFDERLDAVVNPVFEDLGTFLRTHGFHLSSPMRQEGRRSFKFELSENAYVLLIFRSSAVGEFELRCECFVPGNEPIMSKSLGRVMDIDETWTREQMQAALDNFVERLGTPRRERAEELVAV